MQAVLLLVDRVLLLQVGHGLKNLHELLLERLNDFLVLTWAIEHAEVPMLAQKIAEELST